MQHKDHRGHYVAVVPLPPFGFRFIDSVPDDSAPRIPHVADFADSGALSSFMSAAEVRWRAKAPHARQNLSMYNCALQVTDLPAGWPRGHHLRVRACPLVPNGGVGDGCADNGSGKDGEDLDDGDGNDSDDGLSHDGSSDCDSDRSHDGSSDCDSDLGGFIVSDSSDEASNEDIRPTIFKYINSQKHNGQIGPDSDADGSDGDDSVADSYFATQITDHTGQARRRNRLDLDNESARRRRENAAPPN